MAELQLAALLPNFVHGEVHNPAELIALFVHVAFALGAGHLHHDAGGLPHLGLGASAQQHQGVVFQSQLCLDLFHQGRVSVDKLGDAAHNLTLLVHPEPIGLLASLDLHVGAELVDVLAGQLAIGHRHSLDQIPLKGTEAAVLEQLGGVLDPQVNAQVGLVGAKLLHGLEVGDPPEGSLGRNVVGAVLGEDGRQHILDDSEHVLLTGKCHLHIQLIELAGGTVAPGVLVPEAGGDLEIAVKAGGHQQLLELLGSLGQSVELARMFPGRHQVIPSALGGGSGEDGGGDLQESLSLHGPAQLGDHPAAQHDIAAHGGVAQIQIAVLQPGILAGVPGVVDFKGQLVVAAAAQDLDLLGHHFDVAGGQLGVLAGPLPDDTGDGDNTLLIDGLDLGHHLLGLDDHLGHAVEIPQHQEAQIGAHFPKIFQPPGKGDSLTHLLHAQLAAGVGAILCLCHSSSFPFSRF